MAGQAFSECEITPGCHIPDPAIVDVGGTVIMSNPHNVSHAWTSGSVGDDDAGSVFYSGRILPGQSYQWSPDTVGEYPYFCVLHPWLRGTIIVQEAGAMKDDDKMMMMADDPSGTGMLSDGTMVLIKASEPMAGQEAEITVVFKDSEHVNYDIMATQNGVEVLNSEGAHEHEGMGTHMTAALDSSEPLDITITFQGYGVSEPKTGEFPQMVTFTNVVPEFGTIAMMVLAVAIISIVAVTAKSRVVPRL